MIKATIKDEGLKQIIQNQLKSADISWLNVEEWIDETVQGHEFAIYHATLCNSDGAVFNAWIISGGPGCMNFPYAGVYNQENYPTYRAALSQQIGQLALDGSIKLVKPSDATARKRKSKKSPV